MSHRSNPSNSSALAVAAFAAVGAFFAMKRTPQPQAASLDRHADRRNLTKGEERGRQAETPAAIPARGLRDVFWRVVEEISNDRVLLIAAGVSFYLILALFPALTALVSLFGLFADPVRISDNLNALGGVLPPGVVDMINQQITSVVQRQSSSLSFSFLIGLGIALWSAHSGVLALFDAMNVAYEEEEERGYIKLNLVGMFFTICAILVAIVTIGLIGVMPAVLSLMRLDGWTEMLVLILRWPILLLFVFAAIATLYRFGPSRDAAKLRWITWGAGLATVAWFIMSIGFSFYLSHFADYNATYGALGSLIGFLIWTWLSNAIIIMGAELNSELEHQTTKDTTQGNSQPIGRRKAHVADTVGKAAK